MKLRLFFFGIVLVILICTPICFAAETVSRNVYAGSSLVGSISDEGISYLLKDRLGSARLKQGVYFAEFKSLPFGQQVLNTGVKYSFTGKELDANSGLHYFNARYYDSDIGRFGQIDPLRDNHAYSYVANNPMNLIDPTGMTGERAIVLLASPQSDHNGAVYQGIEGAISLIRNHFSEVYVDTVSTADEFFNAFEKGSSELGGTFDFYYGSAHGAPTQVWLGDGVVRNTDFEGRDLSSYFSEGAQGVQSSCAAANTYKTSNPFVKALANSAGIPVTGQWYSASAMLTEDLGLMTAAKHISPGLSYNMNGKYKGENGLIYHVSFENEEYLVTGFSSMVEGYTGYSERGLSWDHAHEIYGSHWEGDNIILPWDFDPDQIYHDYVTMDETNAYTHYPDGYEHSGASGGW